MIYQPLDFHYTLDASYLKELTICELLPPWNFQWNLLFVCRDVGLDEGISLCLPVRSSLRIENVEYGYKFNVMFRTVFDPKFLYRALCFDSSYNLVGFDKYDSYKMVSSISLFLLPLFFLKVSLGIFWLVWFTVVCKSFWHTFSSGNHSHLESCRWYLLSYVERIFSFFLDSILGQ